MALKNDPVRKIAKAVVAAGRRDGDLSIHACAERTSHERIDQKMREDVARSAAMQRTR